MTTVRLEFDEIWERFPQRTDSAYPPLDSDLVVEVPEQVMAAYEAHQKEARAWSKFWASQEQLAEEANLTKLTLLHEEALEEHLNRLHEEALEEHLNRLHEEAIEEYARLLWSKRTLAALP